MRKCFILLPFLLIVAAHPAWACGGGEGATAHLFAGAQTTIPQFQTEEGVSTKLKTTTPTTVAPIDLRVPEAVEGVMDLHLLSQLITAVLSRATSFHLPPLFIDKELLESVINGFYGMEGVKS